MIPLWALLAGCAGEIPPCEGYGEPEALGQLDDPDADEISGLAASAFHEGVFWAHEDESGGAELIAVDAEARALGRWTLTGPAVEDPEDIAVTQGRVLLGDLGDNELTRDSLRILRAPEPNPEGGGGEVDSVEVFTVILPDGPANIEAMLVDPLSGDVVLVEKSGGDPRAWSLSLGEGDEPEVTLLGRVPLEDLPGEVVVTGADVSPDGARVLLRTWAGVLVYERAETQSAWDALNGPVCLAPTGAEPQGEAVAATADGFLTLSEGVGATLWRTLRPM
ncbi:MAG: hypothetical protein H6741_32010 [Alphaproteobacteria bacterium]|nr:hypothetical protein [Alphaproteobacteria bacterium]